MFPEGSRPIPLTARRHTGASHRRRLIREGTGKVCNPVADRARPFGIGSGREIPISRLTRRSPCREKGLKANEALFDRAVDGVGRRRLPSLPCSKPYGLNALVSTPPQSCPGLLEAFV